MSSSTKRLSAKATRRWSHTSGGDSPAGTAACLGAAHPSPSLGTRPWARKKLETREGSLDAKRRKGRRSRSFEATGHKVGAGTGWPCRQPQHRAPRVQGRLGGPPQAPSVTPKPIPSCQHPVHAPLVLSLVPPLTTLSTVPAPSRSSWAPQAPKCCRASPSPRCRWGHGQLAPRGPPKLCPEPGPRRTSSQVSHHPLLRPPRSPPPQHGDSTTGSGQPRGCS